MIEIEYKGVQLNPLFFRVNGKERISWSDLDTILEALPRLAIEKLSWFPVMGPPSLCEEAREEVKEIVKELFKEKHPLEGG